MKKTKGLLCITVCALACLGAVGVTYLAMNPFNGPVEADRLDHGTYNCTFTTQPTVGEGKVTFATGNGGQIEFETQGDGTKGQVMTLTKGQYIQNITPIGHLVRIYIEYNDAQKDKPGAALQFDYGFQDGKGGIRWAERNVDFASDWDFKDVNYQPSFFRLTATKGDLEFTKIYLHYGCNTHAECPDIYRERKVTLAGSFNGNKLDDENTLFKENYYKGNEYSYTRRLEAGETLRVVVDGSYDIDTVQKYYFNGTTPGSAVTNKDISYIDDKGTLAVSTPGVYTFYYKGPGKDGTGWITYRGDYKYAFNSDVYNWNMEFNPAMKSKPETNEWFIKNQHIEKGQLFKISSINLDANYIELKKETPIKDKFKIVEDQTQGIHHIECLQTGNYDIYLSLETNNLYIDYTK